MAFVAAPGCSSFSLFRGFILRSMLGIGRAGDRLRTVLSVLAVGLGVGVVLAIQLANQSSIGSFENSLEEISGKTNLTITGANGVDELLLPRLQALAGRDPRLSPVVEGTAAVAASGEVIRVLGIDILEDRSFREF